LARKISDALAFGRLNSQILLLANYIHEWLSTKEFEKMTSAINRFFEYFIDTKKYKTTYGCRRIGWRWYRERYSAERAVPCDRACWRRWRDEYDGGSTCQTRQPTRVAGL